jgi:DNA-binding transcriptional LysR family regulator
MLRQRPIRYQPPDPNCRKCPPAPFARRSRDNLVTMKLSPRNLVHLIALAEEGRISRAATRVHLSPSAFSRSIQSVEDDLGVQLFHRNMNGVTLTAAGQAVLGHARALDFENKRFELNLDLLRRGDFDRISIGAGPIPASILVPELIRAMHLQTPHMRIHVEFGDMSTLIERLDKNEIDICLGDIRYAAGNEERYASKKLAIVKTIVCCRTGHPLSSVKSDLTRFCGVSAGIGAGQFVQGRSSARFGQRHGKIPMVANAMT